MQARILSLNIGGPEKMEWNGRSVVSSMRKSPIAGPLVVHEDRIEGNTFASPQLHGEIDSILYAFGMTSILKVMRLLGRDSYEPGALGETITLDEFDETQISVGDIFRFGEVLAQATFPRLPCGKVNIRMEHPEGQKLMQDSGMSGVYFRILKPGLIHSHDNVQRTELSPHRFSIAAIYAKMVRNEKPSPQELQLALENGAFPSRIISKWRTIAQT